MISQLHCFIPLPTNFRPGDILAFHRRDAQEIAERVTDTTLQKGMVWRDVPACLSISFRNGQADAILSVDGHVSNDSQPAFEAMILRMLGLAQGIEQFEKRYRDHPQLGPLIARQPGLRVPVAATPFEALTWAVTGQQISVSASVALRRRLISATNVRHTGGLLCYPEAEQITGLTEATLRQAGFSTTKTRTLLNLSQLVADNKLPLEAWTQELPVEEMREQLEAVRGIGPWTVNYALLRGYGWLDGSLHGDAAVRRGLQTLLNSPGKISEDEAREWLAAFSPWRALIAAHIWAAQSSVAY
jgi:DNA-3-methyladenine glycosylase II